jgi:hypothetical protein
MKKHYIDKGKSAFGMPKGLINALGETVFEYSKKIYNELVNKFKTKYKTYAILFSKYGKDGDLSCCCI